MRALCIHGHFYQPPRENPWTDVVDPEPSAAPHHDWNERITAECYAPYGAARILDARGAVAETVNLYAWTSFDVGPTLATWLASHAPAVLEAMTEGDAASRARTGHGNAWAQAYGHAILPLSTPRDVRTQVRWGARAFVHAFGRAPEGMWLPEMAVDAPTLAELAAAGIGLTLLAPHQARRIRRLGAGADAWTAVTPTTLDPHRLYRCPLPGGQAVDVAFRDPALSDGLAFGGMLADGTRLAARLAAAGGEDGDGRLLALAVDGETFGHHHRFAEMALAFALRALREAPSPVTIAGPAAFRAAHPPAWEVEIAEGTSWSCSHGVERWRADCGCRAGELPDASLAWRAPLRAAIDWLRDQLAVVFEREGAAVLRDPWDARDRWIDCVLEPAHTPAFLATEATPDGAARATTLLELARHALLMQTSCGWFFDDLDRIEPRLILGHAARTLELAAEIGVRLEPGFLERLAPARSHAGRSGVDVFRALRNGRARA